MKVVTEEQFRNSGVSTDRLATQINEEVKAILDKGGHVAYIQLTSEETMALLREGMLRWNTTHYVYNHMRVLIAN